MKQIIPIRDLQVGMCLAEDALSAKSHKVLSQGTYITSTTQIEEIFAAGIKFVSIDPNLSLYSFKPKELPKKHSAYKDLKNPEIIVEKIEQESVFAETFYHEAAEVMENAFDDMKLGKKYDKEKIHGVVDNLLDSVARNPAAVLNLNRLREHDDPTFMHSVNVCAITLVLAGSLFNNRELLCKIGTGAILHDVGKLRVPGLILNKRTRHSQEELNILNKHPLYGKKILEEQEWNDNIVLDMVSHHHENFDGSGFPDALFGKQIAKETSICAIANYYDELLLKKPGIRPLVPSEAITMIFREVGEKFDTRLVNHFIKIIGIYPIGSYVRLHTGRIAVVMAFSSRDLLFPIVRVLTDSSGVKLTQPKTLSLIEVDDYIEESLLYVPEDLRW